MSLTPDTSKAIDTLILNETTHLNATDNRREQDRHNARLQGMLEVSLAFEPFDPASQFAPAEATGRRGAHLAAPQPVTLEEAAEAIAQETLIVQRAGQGLNRNNHKRAQAHLEGMVEVYNLICASAPTDDVVELAS